MSTQFAQPQFAMPVPAGQDVYSTNQYALYSNHPQPISPTQSMAGTPVGLSPTSPRTVSHLSAQAKQLRPLKSPLYVPAVLRPTDRPAKKSSTKSGASNSPPNPMVASVGSNGSESIKSSGRRDRMAKAELGSIQENEFRSARTYGEVTGFPTTRHWKLDSNAQICDAPSCRQTFNFFTRRHHCRRCGNIFCDYHSAQVVRLDQEANYHPNGEPVRACDFCHVEYQDWDSSRSRSNSEDGSVSSSGETQVAATPVIGCPTNKMKKGVFGKGIAESLGASVQRDWNWSTF